MNLSSFYEFSIEYSHRGEKQKIGDFEIVFEIRKLATFCLSKILRYLRKQA